MGISDQIIDAIAVKVTEQAGIVSGSIFKYPRAAQSITVSPYALVFTDGPFGVEELRYRQIRRTIPVAGAIAFSMDSGLTVAQTIALVRGYLDGIEFAILNDSTLGGIVMRAVPNLSAPQLAPNSKIVYGPFAVLCQSITRMIGAP